MKQFESSATGGQSKALFVMIAGFVMSLGLSMAAVTLILRLLTHNL